MDFETIKTSTDENLMPTYAHFDVAIESGIGSTYKDFSGKEYIDFTAGIGVTSIGCANPDWVAAVARQAGTLQHISNLYYNEPTARLARKLCSRTGFARVFFGNSGAEANECAIKLARKYSSDKYGEGRGTVLSLVNSFHGRTCATVTATGQDVFHQYFLPFPGGFKYTPANDIEALDAALTGDVCALFLEMIQGEGGVVPLDAGFVAEARKLCSERDVLLIIDEVQTGVGRTGKFFAFENFGIVPDAVTLAKGIANGLPMGACLCSAALAEVMGTSTHGSTFGGNPIASAGACVVLDTLDEKFLSEVIEKGQYIRKKLLEIDAVEDVRGMGMMIGAAIKGITAKEAAAKCAEAGLLILTAKTVLRLLPSLTITYNEIDKGMAILKNVLEGSK